MFLGTVYICVNDINKSVEFYKNLLQEEPVFSNGDRWVQFSNMIALFNRKYDESIMEKGSGEMFNQAYIDEFKRDLGERGNNILVLNFCTNDLRSEYERLKALNIGEISDFMYVNVFAPYWYFNIIDPDGNVIEITGSYNE